MSFPNSLMPPSQAFVYKCTAKEPENRPTAGQALEELETIMGEMGIPMKQQLFRPDGGSSMIAKMTPAQYTVVLGEVPFLAPDIRCLWTFHLFSLRHHE